MKQISFFLLILLFASLVYASGGQADATTAPSLEEKLRGPTLDLNDTVVFVVFKFGAWVRVAYNNSKVVAPVAVYVFSRSDFPVIITSNNKTWTWQGYWGLALNLTKLDINKPLIISIKYKNKEYTLRFMIVKSIEEKEETAGPMLSLKQVKEWLDREAQYATVLAFTAIALAVIVKRKTLLMRTFNALNIALVLLLGGAIWVVAPKLNHSGWLAAPFVISYLLSYSVLTVGRRIYLIKIIPSLKKIMWERAVLYRTGEGLLAYAKQSVSEAFKRMFGNHIILKDAEISRLGEISSNKFWTVEDVEFYEKSEALLVIDAVLTKEKILPEKEKKQGGVKLYE